MKELTLLSGTRDELAEHFSKLLGKPIKKGGAGDYLTSKSGIKKQLDEIFSKHNGVGTVYYLTRTEIMNTDKLPEVNLELIGKYVHIRGPEIDFKNITKEIKKLNE